MGDRVILTVTITQGPPDTARLAWQLNHDGVQAIGLARTVRQALRDVAELLGEDLDRG